jgi:hypothetical protein
MSDMPALRVSDTDRERAVVLLREHATEGRLTLEEFTDRMAEAYRAVTAADLEALASDLPPANAPVASRRAPTRFALSIFGSNHLEGRIRVRDRLACIVAFGSIDLDLRHATLERDEATVVALVMFGSVDVYVPEGVEVDLRGLPIFGHKGAHGNDPLPQQGAPLVRVYAFPTFGAVSVWRVPIAWAQRSLHDIVRGITRGDHKELEA